MFNFIVSTVPADALAPRGARPNAGTVMNNFRYRMRMEPGRNTEIIYMVCIPATHETRWYKPGL